MKRYLGLFFVLCFFLSSILSMNLVLEAQVVQNAMRGDLKLLYINKDGDAIIDCSEPDGNCVIVLPKGSR